MSLADSFIPFTDIPFPEDPVELESALRAGVISYRAFPYLKWRYGERGERFTRNDSAWLVWLTRHQQTHVDEQITWLRSVLSNRGMPSWILSAHLRVLYRQLIRVIPEREEKYVRLENNARRLRQITEENISEESATQLVTDFCQSVRLPSNSLVHGAARLLIAALADERSGVPNAVESLVTWLADVAELRRVTELRQRLCPDDRDLFDSTEFAKRWPEAIDAVIVKAREAR